MARKYHKFIKDADEVADNQEQFIYNCEEAELDALKTEHSGTYTWVEEMATADAEAIIAGGTEDS
jgi:hypothetical protein|tara:strand:- start:7 stop:201 length:195 start_codon:yes stop_codon:yes gene_type:complete